MATNKARNIMMTGKKEVRMLSGNQIVIIKNHNAEIRWHMIS